MTTYNITIITSTERRTGKECTAEFLYFEV